MKNLIQELHSLLFEYKRDVTEKILGSKIEKAASEDGTTLAKVLDTLEQADPSKNKQYVEWLCKQYIQKLFKLEDINRANETLLRFDKIKNKLEQKDINKYTFHQLESLMDKHFDDVVLDVDAKDVEGAKIVYNGPLGQLTIPSTRKASCELGKGTKWCTAANKNNMFDHYHKQGPLYIWKDKSGEKYQFHFESGQFMDDKDVPISDAKVEEFRHKNPVLKKLFAHNEENLIDNLTTENGRRAIVSYALKFVKLPWKQLEDKIMSSKNPEMALAYSKSILKKPWPDGEKIIAADAKSAFEYATEVLKKKWPEGEETLLKHRHYGALYTQKFPKSSFKDFAKK